MRTILGIFDILAGLVILGSNFGPPKDIMVWTSVYLILKGLIFAILSLIPISSFDFLGILDIACGIMLILNFFITIPFGILAIAGVYLVGKGLLSLRSF